MNYDQAVIGHILQWLAWWLAVTGLIVHTTSLSIYLLELPPLSNTQSLGKFYWLLVLESNHRSRGVLPFVFIFITVKNTPIRTNFGVFGVILVLVMFNLFSLYLVHILFTFINHIH